MFIVPIVWLIVVSKVAAALAPIISGVTIRLLCLRRTRTTAIRRSMIGIPIPRPTPNAILVELSELFPLFTFDEGVDVVEAVNWVVKVLTVVKGDKL